MTKTTTNDTASTDIAVAVSANPGIVLLDTEKFDAWYNKLKAKAPTDADVETKKGRDVLRSFAAEVRSEKAGIDKARLRLTAEWRGMVSQANDAGKVIAERLEGLAVEVRAPLTAWEDAEKARVDSCVAFIESLRLDGVISLEDTADAVRERGMRVWGEEINPVIFGDMMDEAESAKSAAVAALKSALVRLEKEEADRAELEKLRADAAAREEVDRIAAELAEIERQEAARKEAERAAGEQAKIEAVRQAKLAEEKRAAEVEAEQERIERAKAEAAEAAQRAAEEAAKAERERIQREHDEAIAAERKRAEDAERAAQAERDRAEAEAAERAATAKREADEQAKRENDKANRTRLKTAAKLAIMSCGADEETAQKIVLAIIAGEVPAVTLRF